MCDKLCLLGAIPAHPYNELHSCGRAQSEASQGFCLHLCEGTWPLASYESYVCVCL